MHIYMNTKKKKKHILITYQTHTQAKINYISYTFNLDTLQLLATYEGSHGALKLT